MKKVVSILTLFCLFLPVFAFAQQLPNPIKWNNFADLINALIDFLFNVALLVVPIMIIIGGFYFITAAGEPAKIETGKRLIWYALIGLIIILLAKGVVTMVKTILGVVA